MNLWFLLFLGLVVGPSLFLLVRKVEKFPAGLIWGALIVFAAWKAGAKP